MFESDLHAFWAAHPDLGGGSPAITLWPVKPPVNPTFPLATYQRISGSEEYIQEGVTDFQEPRIQFTVYHQGWEDCWDAAARVRNVFKAFKGTMGSSTEVQKTTKDNDFDLPDPESGLPRRLLDFFIRYREIA